MPSLPARILHIPLRLSRSLLTTDLPTLRSRADFGARWIHPPAGVHVEPANCPTPAEWLTPPGTMQAGALLYIHGGGFVFCSPATHRGLVGRLSAASRVRALSLDYRLAPEHPSPAGLEDCLAAYRWLLDAGTPPEQVVFGGDSAGGNLTLALLLAARQAGLPLPSGAVCLSPVTEMSGAFSSRRSLAQADPILPPETKAWGDSYLAGADPLQPLISPYYADLHGLPPILIQVGSEEILRDDAVLFAEKARRCGVEVRLEVYEGMWHVFQAAGAVLPEARQAVRSAGAFIRERLGAVSSS